MSNASKPVAKIGFPVTASIWRKEKDGRASYSATFQRSYKDDKGKRKYSDTFYPDDLLALAKVADQAHTEISKLRAADRQAQSGDDEAEPAEDEQSSGE
jgi:hypothetical protein